MARANYYSFHFDTINLHLLRDAINEDRHLSIEKQSTLKNNKSNVPYYAWDRICAILDRLDDTVDYLNKMELGHCRSPRSAFDFYEFLNCVYTVIDGIKTLGLIFDYSCKDLEDSNEIFQNPIISTGNDGLFFEYIRSLCSVHPFCTNYPKYPYLDGAKLHCCPYVIWVKDARFLPEDVKGDLIAYIYTSEKDKNPIRLYLEVNQFVRYLEKWMNSIPEIINAIHISTKQTYSEFMRQAIKGRDDFSEDGEWIRYLEKECSKRFGKDCAYGFEDCLLFFENDLTNPSNQVLLQKYRNAILYSLTFLKNQMQNMSLEGFENTGLLNTDIQFEGMDLFWILIHLSEHTNALSKYDCILSKAYYLLPDSGHAYYEKTSERSALIDIKDVINQFIVFTGEESDTEQYLLVCLMKYQDALSSKTILNRNIPNSREYRTALLSDKEYKDLFMLDPELEKQAKKKGFVLAFHEDGSDNDQLFMIP